MVDPHGLNGQGGGTAVCPLVSAVSGIARWLNPNKLRGLNSLAHVVQWLVGIEPLQGSNSSEDGGQSFTLGCLALCPIARKGVSPRL